MIRLATCFTGIGAIEHALNRLGLDNEIIFACDNGDVDILKKSIPLDVVEIEKELVILNNRIENLLIDKKILLDDFLKIKESFNNYVSELKQSLNDEFVLRLKNIVDNIAAMDKIKAAKLKEYRGFVADLENKSSNITNKRLYSLVYANKVITLYLKNNAMSDLVNDNAFKSSDGIIWSKVNDDLKYIIEKNDTVNGKKIIKSVKDICERLGMLHERIDTISIKEELRKLTSYDDKKKFIDNLYKGKEERNKVKTSYMANYNLKDRHFHWNASFLDGHEYEGQVDLFVGGSPCQSFSLVGKQRGLEDTRGTLFYEYARLVKEIKPKVFIYENVRALLSNDNGRTWGTMSEVFTSLNYTWKMQVLNAKDYGIPQNRERVFVVGFRNDLKLDKNFEFPKPIPLNTTMKDYLMDNVSGKYYLPQKGVDFVTSDKNLTKRYTQIDGEISLCQKKNQQFNWHGDFIFEEEHKEKDTIIKDLEKYFLSDKVKKYVLDSGTKNFYSKPEIDLDIARPLLTTMHKMHRAGIDNYVTTEGRLRKLTPRECLRLMGFSDSFKIVVSDTSMYQQSGNSIVVDVLMHIVSSIIESYNDLIEVK